MKIKIITLLALILCMFLPVAAQKNKPSFHSINMAGISDGESGAHFLWQTVNGVAFNKWFSGVGFGGDYYHYKSYPLFADVRRYFGNKNTGFAYVDLGYNLDAKNKPGKEIYYTSYHFYNGIYSDFGLGYTMKFTRKSSLLISAGYSYKEINNKIGVSNECFVAPCTVDYSNYKYGNGRVVLKAGVDF